MASWVSLSLLIIGSGTLLAVCLPARLRLRAVIILLVLWVPLGTGLWKYETSLPFRSLVSSFTQPVAAHPFIADALPLPPGTTEVGRLRPTEAVYWVRSSQNEIIAFYQNLKGTTTKLLSDSPAMTRMEVTYRERRYELWFWPAERYGTPVQITSLP